MQCCVVDVQGESNPSFCSLVVRKARKVHRCVECRRVIPRGARYIEESGRWEYGWGRYRTCELCYNVRRDRFQCGWYYGHMWDDLLDAFGEKFEDDSWLMPPTHPIMVET